MYRLVYDADSTELGFIPKVIITEGERVLVQWRGSFPLTTRTAALDYAKDYGEVRLDAMRASG